MERLHTRINTFKETLYLILSAKHKEFVLITLSIVVAGSAFLLPRIPQSATYHNFADARRILGIPNFWNVISNLPFVLIGMAGLLKVSSAKTNTWICAIYYTLFFGVAATGLGSAWYHLFPNNDTLVWDRLPMTIVFMAFLSAVTAEWIAPIVGFRLFIPLLIIGISSVLWWHYTESNGHGDLRLYALVQFYPIILIPLIIILYYRTGQRPYIRIFLLIVLWYVVAKLFELFDSQIYRNFPLSGHTLKHLAASISTYYFVLAFSTRYVKKDNNSATYLQEK